MSDERLLEDGCDRSKGLGTATTDSGVRGEKVCAIGTISLKAMWRQLWGSAMVNQGFKGLEGCWEGPFRGTEKETLGRLRAACVVISPEAIMLKGEVEER